MRFRMLLIGLAACAQVSDGRMEQATPPASLTGAIRATFVERGPAGIAGGDTAAPNTGAINAVVPHPDNPDILWAATVGGGVWKTTNATSVTPIWLPLTDHAVSLSISALDLDPTDAGHQVLVAAIGSSSSLSSATGPRTGVLRTTDGGANWTALGGSDLAAVDLSGVAARGDHIVVGSDSKDDATGGIWLSTDTGASFTHLSGNAPLSGCAMLPPGGAHSIVGDPTEPQRLYAAIGKANGTGGVFRSDDRGECWIALGGETFGGAAPPGLLDGVVKMKLSARRFGGSHDVVYAAINSNPTNTPKSVVLVGMFRSADSGGHWTRMDADTDLNPTGESFLAIAGDPFSETLVYLGGDSHRAPGGIAKCDAAAAPGNQCSPIMGAGNQAVGQDPHEDARGLVFDQSKLKLLYACDGGLFQRPFPESTSFAWSSINGNLAVNETYSCAWDHFVHIPFCGMQDNGVADAPSPGAAAWEALAGGDGGVVAVGYDNGLSFRYYSTQKLGGFTREVCAPGNFCVSTKPALQVTDPPIGTLTTIDAALSERTPLAVLSGRPTCVAIATDTVYESSDGAETLTRLTNFSGTATLAIAYGPGASCATGSRPVLYVGSSSGLFLRDDGSDAMRKTSYPSEDGEPRAIALDPGNWKSAWVLTAGALWHSADASDVQVPWSKVTGDLAAAGAHDLRDVAFIPDASGAGLVIGANDGVYGADLAGPEHWSKLIGALPNVNVFDLDYDGDDHLLLIGTMGRGAWTMAVHSPTSVAYTGPSRGDFHDAVTLSAVLTDAGSAPIANETLSFELGGESCSAETDATGMATCKVTPLDLPGLYAVMVRSSGGEPVYSPSSTSAPFVVDREETTTVFVGPTVILAGAPITTLSGRLVEDGSNDADGDGGSPGPFRAEPVTLSLGGQSCTGTTNASGDVSCTIASVTVPLGPQLVTASFSGDDYYLPSSNSASAIVFEFPAGGAFVLGDLTVATATPSSTVTWWSSNWAADNVLSGGAAPPAFKGFASEVNLPMTSPAAFCNVNWTSRSGNSPHPPATVPSYMGVVVATSVTKGPGGTISGDYVEIVVVRTNAGYEPNPGHAGTGTVVARFCP